MTRNILIFGAQGSGKGTQAEMLSKNFGFVYISTGNLFRKEIQQHGGLGKAIDQYIKKGKLVPDDITNQMVAKTLLHDDIRHKGFIMEGYPRNKGQMLALEKITHLSDVIVIDISDKEAIFRIGGRMVCVCGKTYHKVFNLPKRQGFCDACGAKLFVRDDDKPKAIKKRLEIYHQETEPLFHYYSKKGILRRIDGEQPIPEVYRDVVKALGLEK